MKTLNECNAELIQEVEEKLKALLSSSKISEERKSEILRELLKITLKDQ